MTKTDLADRIQEKISCQKKEAVELVELVMEMLKDAIATEGLVKISGFGNFVVRQKADRNGRNPLSTAEVGGGRCVSGEVPHV